MTQAVTIYRAYVGEHMQLVTRELRKHGFTPEVLDNPDPDPVMRYASKGGYKVRIAVPKEHAKEARLVLRTWEKENAKAIAPLVRNTHKQLSWAMTAIAVVAILLRLAYGNWTDPPWGLVFLFNLVGLAFASHAKEILRSIRRVPPGRCHKCRYNLRGNVSGRCPECGTPVRQSQVRRVSRAGRRRRRRK